MTAIPNRESGSSAKIVARLARSSDILLAVLIITIVGMLIVPLPEWLLDTMLVINITSSVVVLLTSLYTTAPLQFSVFPSLLLVMTLFRLSLNVAATKLILGSGHAGAVIDAFGKFVVGGSYVVGIIAFLILVVVNFVVITKGAERVAEVAARFTLDAMPGKQMAIDADMNAGLINEQQARERRVTISREADFYGAMDGASKFVRGDAMASVLILIINVVGGFALGMSRGGDVMTVLQNYTLLTIGEGLVSQIPALLISTATGLLVTRAASDRPMGQDFTAQLLSRPRPLMIVSGLLVCMLFLPGFPKPQIALLAVCMGGSARMIMIREKREALTKESEDAKAGQADATAPDTPETVLAQMVVEPLEVKLGSNLVPLADAAQGGDLGERVINLRKQIALELGIVLPTVRICDNLQLKANCYQVTLKGATVAMNELFPNSVLALDSGFASEKLEGRETVEPALGTPAIWIAKSLKERAEMSGYITVDPSTVLVTHLAELIKSHGHELLTRQETQKLIDHVKKKNEAVVNELVPNHLTLGEVQKVLQSLLRERVSIRDLATILETLADHAPRTKDFDALTEFSRSALSRSICKQYQEADGTLRVITLVPALEQDLRDAVQPTPTGNMLAIDPPLAQSIVRGLTEQIQSAADKGFNPVLLCSGAIRLPLKRLIERSLPSLPVLAYTEIAQNVEVESLGTVAVDLQLVAA